MITSKEAFMPIFEFKCEKCEEFFEILILGGKDEEDVQCPKCQSHAFERVLSTTNYAMTGGGDPGQKATQTTRTCSGGNCTTYNIPGHVR